MASQEEGVRYSNSPGKYITLVNGNNSGVPVYGETKLTVEVRDEYNNPVSGVTVDATQPNYGKIVEDSQVTGTDGKATFTYSNDGENLNLHSRVEVRFEIPAEDDVVGSHEKASFYVDGMLPDNELPDIKINEYERMVRLGENGSFGANLTQNGAGSTMLIWNIRNGESTLETGSHKLDTEDLSTYSENLSDYQFGEEIENETDGLDNMTKITAAYVIDNMFDEKKVDKEHIETGVSSSSAEFKFDSYGNQTVEIAAVDSTGGFAVDTYQVGVYSEELNANFDVSNVGPETFDDMDSVNPTNDTDENLEDNSIPPENPVGDIAHFGPWANGTQRRYTVAEETAASEAEWGVNLGTMIDGVNKSIPNPAIHLRYQYAIESNEEVTDEKIKLQVMDDRKNVIQSVKLPKQINKTEFRNYDLQLNPDATDYLRRQGRLNLRFFDEEPDSTKTRMVVYDHRIKGVRELNDKSSGRVDERIWSIGDDRVVNEPGDQRKYESGNTNVKLEVKEMAGGSVWESDSYSREVYVPSYPEANLTKNRSTIEVGEPVRFDASNSAPSSEIESYVWSLYGKKTSGPKVVHTFNEYGKHEVGVQVKKEGDQWARDSEIRSFDVNHPPTVKITESPSTVRVNENAEFTASPDDPYGKVESVKWSFGDSSTATGKSVEHSFDSPGVYDVSVTVTDDDGATVEANATVNVNSPPTIESINADETVEVGQRVSYSADASDPGPGTINSYLWTFPDGETASGDTVTHTYNTEGTKTAKLTVKDEYGATDEGQVSTEVKIMDTLGMKAKEGEMPNFKHSGSWDYEHESEINNSLANTDDIEPGTQYSFSMWENDNGKDNSYNEWSWTVYRNGTKVQNPDIQQDDDMMSYDFPKEGSYVIEATSHADAGFSINEFAEIQNVEESSSGGGGGGGCWFGWFC
ncbi:MAG: PKD domain-containing protein [Halobacteria archaeon]